MCSMWRRVADARQEMEREQARLQAELETLASAKLEVERQREDEMASRTEAENRAKMAEEQSAELHTALSSLTKHCEDLEAREATMKEQQQMVAELRSSTEAALNGEQEQEICSSDVDGVEEGRGTCGRDLA